jgi:uracil-DNA glycosylase
VRWLAATIDRLPELRVVVCLGRLAFDAVVKEYRRRGWLADRPALRFGHGAEFAFPAAPALLCSYHPSQQNTFTGRLTDDMLRAVFMRARKLADRE